MLLLKAWCPQKWMHTVSTSALPLMQGPCPSPRPSHGSHPDPCLEGLRRTPCPTLGTPVRGCSVGLPLMLSPPRVPPARVKSSKLLR